MEYLVDMTISVPVGTPPDTVGDLAAREAARAAELAEGGSLLRLWSLPDTTGVRRTLGLWRAADEAELTGVLASLPLRPWMRVVSTPLTAHPNDPVNGRQR